VGMADYLIGIKEYIKRRNDEDNRLYLNKILNGANTQKIVDKKSDIKMKDIDKK